MTPITDGIININKPTRWTSHDCVAVIRKLLGIKRVGHMGTLDPMASGVLPVCIGSSTRIMEYLDLDYKTYHCEMQLGIETDTLDIWGEILRIGNSSHISEEDVRSAVQPFRGIISQIPPKYSAIKVKGKKLYQYARAGEEVERKPRKVWIENLSITSMNLQQQRISFTVTCSKGTYIRSISRDVGERLGCGGTMTALTRTMNGTFTLEESVDLENLRNMELEQIYPLMLATDYPLAHFGQVQVDKQQAVKFCNGRPLPVSDVTVEREPKYAKKSFPLEIPAEYKNAYNIYWENTFLGVALAQRRTLVADKVFFRGHK